MPIPTYEDLLADPKRKYRCYPEGFVIDGWELVNGEWLTIGAVPGVVITPSVQSPNMIQPIRMEDQLNAMEHEIRILRDLVVKLSIDFSKE